jgi:ABC-2 type transport system permease protein
MTTIETEPALVEATLRSAVSNGARPPRPTPLVASLTFGWRAMLKIKHVPMQLFDVTAFPIMFVVLYTYLFGGALAGSPSAYLQQLLPGILVMTVSWITMYTGQALNTDISKGIFDRFRSLQIWRPAVLVGMLLADAVRYSLASAVVIGLGSPWASGPKAERSASCWPSHCCSSSRSACRGCGPPSAYGCRHPSPSCRSA